MGRRKTMIALGATILFAAAYTVVALWIGRDVRQIVEIGMRNGRWYADDVSVRP